MQLYALPEPNVEMYNNITFTIKFNGLAKSNVKFRFIKRLSTTAIQIWNNTCIVQTFFNQYRLRFNIVNV